MVGSLIRKVCSSVFPLFSLYPSAQALVILGGRSENRMFWCRWYCNSRWEERKIFWPGSATPTPGCEWKLAENTEQKHLQSHPSILSIQFNSSQNWNILERLIGQVTQMVTIQITIMTLRQTGRFETLKITLLSFSIPIHQYCSGFLQNVRLLAKLCPFLLVILF